MFTSFKFIIVWYNLLIKTDSFLGKSKYNMVKLLNITRIYYG